MPRDAVTRAACQFRLYDGEARSGSDYTALMALFDANVPDAFAPNERSDFKAFLEGRPRDYHVVLLKGQVVGAFGVMDTKGYRARLTWIMLSPRYQGLGIGREMMKRACNDAKNAGCGILDIAASHVSAPFFDAFGAIEHSRISNGWGAGMDRVDMVLNLV